MYRNLACYGLGDAVLDGKVAALQTKITELQAKITDSQSKIFDYGVSLGASQTKIDALKLENTNLTAEKTIIRAKPALTSVDKQRIFAIDKAVRLNTQKISKETAIMRPFLTKQTTEDKNLISYKALLATAQSDLAKLIPVPATPQGPWTINPNEDWTPITQTTSPTAPPPPGAHTTPPPVNPTAPVTSGFVWTNNMMIGAGILAYLLLRGRA
mgnify:CR=1 FL=1